MILSLQNLQISNSINLEQNRIQNLLMYLKLKYVEKKYYQGKKLVWFSNHICNQVTVYHQNIFHGGKNVAGSEPCLYLGFLKKN